MKQNIYDNDAFFDRYRSFRKNESGYNRYLEEPSLRAFLPNMKGKTILDIGCGFGDFSRFAMHHGVKEYLGIDISEKMITEASKSKGENTHFLNSAIEDYSSPQNRFDLVVASLCLHYVADYEAICEKCLTS